MRVIFILSFLLIASFGYSQAEISIQRYTVQQIKDQASKFDKMDVLVELKGTVGSRVEADEDEFWFTDATGRLQIEFEDENPTIATIKEGMQIIIIGEVDHDLLETVEVEVEQWRPVRQENEGETQ